MDKIQKENQEQSKWLTPKKETILHIINILLLLTLCIAIYTNGKDLSCDQCRINFNSERVFNTYSENFSVGILDLYNYYQEKGECLVFWDHTQGYIRNG